MKKIRRLMSLALVLLMCMAMAAPVSATERTNLEDVEFLTPASLNETRVDILPGEDTFTPVAPSVLGDAEEGDHDEAAPLATTVQNTVSVRSVTIYPLVVCVETGDVYRLDAVKRSRFWTVSTQSDNLRLSPEAVTAFVNEAITLLNSSSETIQYTWGVVGWNVEGSVDLTAQRPLRVESTPHCSWKKDDYYETTTNSVSSQYTTLNLSCNYGFPANPDAYYYIGFRGGFYFRYTSGKEGSLMLGCGVMMNYTA